ncbi:MAG: signal peptidase I [Defluviitaleaceae bacterium]|nr:signal peptidase I [Defluviitaleaceae bacterium]
MEKVKKSGKSKKIRLFRFKNEDLNGWLESLTILIFIIGILYIFFWPARISGGSMTPNLNYNDMVTVSRAAVFFNNFNHGDLILARIEILGHNENIIKRLIAMPGDIVQITEQGIAVNGDYLQLSDFNPANQHINREFILKDNEYFIMGDNQQTSIDSRHFGIIYRNQIIARAVLRFFPLNRIQIY